MKPLACWSRLIGTVVFFSLVCESAAQLEDVTLDYLMESSTFGSLFGCGLSTVDYNGDGWDDVTVAGTDGLIKLYMGGESGLILDLVLDVEAEAKAVLWVDIDNDGDLDLFAGAAGVGVYLYIRQPDGTLNEEGSIRGIPLLVDWDNRGISARDYDRDGDLDIYIASYHDEMQQIAYENMLFQNGGTGYFEETTFLAGVGDGLQHSFQGAWFDYDQNGFDDLWVINDRLIFLNALYANAGGGPFVDISESSGANISVNSMSATLFDPDNDGDWDQYVTNVENLANAFMINTAGVYYDMAESAGVASMQYGWGTCAIDVDGDRWDDMMVATYRFPNTLPYDNHLYMNDGTGLHFEDVTDDWPNEQFQLYCLGRLDLDQDRIPDIVGHGNALSPQVLMLTNEDDNNRMTIDLVGTLSNTRGVGAVIKVHADSLTQMKQMNAGEDYMTQHTYTRFFGLGDVDVVDSIEVFWPSGIRDILFDVAADTALVIVEAAGSLEPIESSCEWDLASWTVPFDPATVDMTWNGVPVTSDIVVAEAPGEWTLEASWWGGGYTWSQTVSWNPELPPSFSLDVVPGLCFGDSALVSWSMPDSALVTLDSIVLPVYTEGLPFASGSFELQIEVTNGCVLDTTFTVIEPDELSAQVGVIQPSCAGDLGSAVVVATGGTGTLTIDAGGADLSALMPGVVPFNISDDFGCVFTDSLEIVSPDSLIGLVSFGYIGSSDSVQIVSEIFGGTPPYSWNWNGAIDDEGMALAPLDLGWYVQDANGCLDLGALNIAQNPLSGISNAQDAVSWSCLRMGSALGLYGPDGERLDVSVYDLSGRLLVRKWNVPASSALELWTDVPVVVTGIDAAGSVFRWLR